MRLASSHLRARTGTGVHSILGAIEHERAAGERREAPVRWLASELARSEIRSRALRRETGRVLESGRVELRLRLLLGRGEFRCPVRRCRRRRRVWPDSVSSTAHARPRLGRERRAAKPAAIETPSSRRGRLRDYLIASKRWRPDRPSSHRTHPTDGADRLGPTLYFFLETSTPDFGLCVS